MIKKKAHLSIQQYNKIREILGYDLETKYIKQIIDFQTTFLRRNFRKEKDINIRNLGTFKFSKEQREHYLKALQLKREINAITKNISGGTSDSQSGNAEYKGV